jgi:predicted DCC family thiol-disulfide oxidoreductase YuxK
VKKTSEPKATVYIDGVCVLCGSTAKWLIRRDKNRNLQFAALQSGYAKSRLPEEVTESVSYIVVEDKGRIYTKSEALVRILKRLGGGWKILAALFGIIPTFIRDWGYGLVARTRYKIFGKKEYCEIPAKGMRERFVDRDDAVYGK